MIMFNTIKNNLYYNIYLLTLNILTEIDLYSPKHYK